MEERTISCKKRLRRLGKGRSGMAGGEVERATHLHVISNSFSSIQIYSSILDS